MGPMKHPFNIVIEADTAEELVAKVQELAGVLSKGGSLPPTSPTKAATSSEAARPASKGKPVPASSKTKGKAAPAPAPVVEDEATEESGTVEAEEEAAPVEADPFADEEATALTADDTKAALQKVFDKDGNFSRCNQILGKFKDAAGAPIKKVGSIQEADYPAFIAECQKLAK